MASTLVKLACAAAVAALAPGCAMGIKDHRGFVIDKELAQGIQVGVDNKDSVAKTLGRPTFTGQFNENDWYYVSQDTRTVAFRSQKTLDQDVLKISFDAAGNVAAINRSDETLIAAIDPVNDKTPTLGRKRGFFDELLGNVGVFSSGALGGGNTPQN
ncbi:outer membrane protein assembly factor BamE [Sphingomonas mesophila]|uniref:outer membrane protein assembly factor BamE n=1 Tax=Sphingomonas mesophila TaxID=2303576 RepID=UPI000E56CD7C|nr:outer membrane protein assembly factor BamE [Sphingomonas mesophila]